MGRSFQIFITMPHIRWPCWYSWFSMPTITIWGQGVPIVGPSISSAFDCGQDLNVMTIWGFGVSGSQDSRSYLYTHLLTHLRIPFFHGICPLAIRWPVFRNVPGMQFRLIDIESCRGGFVSDATLNPPEQIHCSIWGSLLIILLILRIMVVYK